MYREPKSKCKEASKRLKKSNNDGLMVAQFGSIAGRLVDIGSPVGKKMPHGVVADRFQFSGAELGHKHGGPR